MRKFAKITLVASVCAIVAGGMLCIGSFATGNIKNVTVGEGIDVSDDDDNNSKYDIEKVEVEAFDSFDIDSDVINVEFVEDDTFAIEYHGKSKPEYSVSNGKFTFKSEYKKKRFSIDLHFGELIGGIRKHNRLIVYTPDAAKFKEGKVEADAGNITLNSLNADKIILSADAGNIDVNESEIGDCNISADAGNIKADESTMKSLTIETSAGNIKLTDLSTDEADIKSDAGNIKADIIGSRDEYDLKIENDMGNIKIDGQKVHDIEEETGKDKKIDIGTDMGNIKINFK